MSFGPGQDLVNGGVARAEAWQENYTTKMYHQPDDECSPDWDFTGMAEDAELLHAVGLRLANSSEWPNWSPDSEFRAARDRTAAERGETRHRPHRRPEEEGRTRLSRSETSWR